MSYQDYIRHGANLGGTAGAAGGAAGGNILSRALGGVVDALDAPRQAITNLGRSGYRALTGEGGWDDVLSAIPGAAGGLVSGGLIASGAGAPLGILAGSLLGGATQLGMKAADEGRTDEEGNPLGNRFEAASTDDLARGMGFDPDEDLLGKAASFGLGMATDPLSYTGGALGKALGAKAGGKLGEEVAWRGIQNRRAANLGEGAIERMGQGGMDWLPGAGAAPAPTPLRSILADDFGDVMRNSPSAAPEGAMKFSDVLQGKVQFPRSSPNSTMGDWAAPFVDSKMPTRPVGPGVQEGSFKFADDAPTRAGGGAGQGGGFIDFGAPPQGGSMAMPHSMAMPAPSGYSPVSDSFVEQLADVPLGPDGGLVMEPFQGGGLTNWSPGRFAQHGLRRGETMMPQIGTAASPDVQAMLQALQGGDRSALNPLLDALQEGGGRLTEVIRQPGPSLGRPIRGMPQTAEENLLYKLIQGGMLATPGQGPVREAMARVGFGQ